MDAALITAARNGDENAFHTLYREHAGRVRRLVERWVSDPVAVDDLCQESWLRAFRGLDSFRGDAGFGTWIHTIVRNVVLSRGRTDQRRGELLEESWRPRLSTPPEPMDLRVDLRRAVDALPPGMRRVLWLHDVEGWTHADIGAALGVAEGTSKSQLFKARARIRESLRGGPPS
ncbi:MAG: sigma-70 family RNA polymerase sigma factor [Gemmatimonadetes bacterium]|nr:RNA polymerase sigma factor [Gemmatimonadota bacterium]NIQ54102.1 RNA polymerase sigma factor [Gemmatimonadota bacterium]NIU74300.1 sigma-70 family RNA polymerase sigma factor [Gammaproteobacteria bacterium]NIX44305.1 sigma-70 family RNA polymerase sigma factor [Gemmatimonadota bacterium]NIY08528.1 sigma-70 family RNA polymerase sigma factor [Gemmatimonadota bacterium]